ncbi:deoxyribose-phosphate aldolase [Bacillus ginsengihumi]|uniref:Deoxyribose-phosphate aldolase n=1 Tax=Heyndrickxia ginsengihumi TaxID=363870 RepID=A0A0A6Y228_9BACI|nr:deoxyribose-phosphate aldolase [Heyndrickxia ginsengihumi]KHD86297.1 deoxyribose-phosphate aldolase [Heyndrickxia ginsengihumi]MBE6185151.1 deoxyribose-phosphate aldolase [Bacillus sp. (in: firmicutes)]NEY20021.1 deoxyribose-phosphate aldolase [Heyndrickxia ginsengihumi]
MELATFFDHTILKADAKKEEIERLIAEAKQYHFASVCINPVWVPFASEALKGCDVKVCTVIGFPLGATTTAAKVFETEDAITNGASEVDMVISIGLLKEGDDQAVEEDIRAVVNTAKNKAIVKVIIETSLLTDEEKVRACQLAKKAGADFVKTSTGFSTGGANVADVALMRKTVGEKMGVKASGGIHTLKDAKALIRAGATRLGASASVKIMNEEYSIK